LCGFTFILPLGPTITAINGTTIDDAALQHVVVGPQKTFIFSRPKNYSNDDKNSL